MQDLSFKCYWCQHQIDITKNGEYVGLRDYFKGKAVCEDCWILLNIRRHQKDYVEHNWATGEDIRVTVGFAEKELEKRKGKLPFSLKHLLLIKTNDLFFSCLSRKKYKLERMIEVCINQKRPQL